MSPQTGISRKFSEIEYFESRQGTNHELYRRKLIGNGVSRSIARVHTDQTRPLDTLWTCGRPRVRVSEPEIQYLASVGRPPSVPAEAPTQRFQTGIFLKFPEIENFESRQGPNHGLYRRKLIGNGAFRSIAGVHIDPTRPPDTLWTCLRPRVRVPEAEIQYLTSVGRLPSVPA